MVKIRTLKNSRVRTRGTLVAMQRDQAVVNIFRKNGARLVDAHGSLADMNQKAFEIVPPNTVVIFLSEIGYCATTQVTRQLENEFFRSAAKLEAFFRGAAAFQGRHYGNAYSRTYLPGEEYPSISLQFWDETLAGVGYVYKLPLRRDRPINSHNIAPGINNVNYPLSNTGTTHIKRAPHHRILLQDLMTRLGPGVYIIASCVVPPGQIGEMYPHGRMPMSLPLRMPSHLPASKGWKHVAPIRTSETIRIGLHKGAGVAKPTRPQRPGTPARTKIKNWQKKSIRRKGRITVRTALQRLSRVANTVNENDLKNRLAIMRPYLNANVDMKKLGNVIYYLKRPAEFLKNVNNANTTLAFYNTNNLNKGAFIYNRL